MNIVAFAFDMSEAVKRFVTRAKQFYYLVMLFGCRCTKCNGSLTMIAEDRCKCGSCRYEFDPTVEFQRCSACGGVPVLRVRRYQCKKCGSDIHSVFLFDGTVFDARYFCAKMAESRQRKKQQRQRVREMLAECRSEPLALEAADLDSVPGLVEALNNLTGGLEISVPVELKGKFDLNRYQSHVKSCLEAGPRSLRQIPPLIANLRMDLIWRFIAVIFLEQARSVTIRQQGQTIWVMKFDDRQRQDIPGEAEEVNGRQGPVCRVKAW
jgi:hypothetical protein